MEPNTNDTGSGAVGFDKEIDLSGLNCPLPILRTKAAFATMQKGQVLKVTYSHSDSVRELKIFVQQTGYEVLDERHEEGKYVFLVRKTSAA